MATVTERKPGVWLARAFLPPSADGPGRQVAKTFRGAKKAVRAEVAVWEADLRGRPPVSIGATVADLLTMWHEARTAEWQPTTVRDHRSRAARITDDLGTVRLVDLDRCASTPGSGSSAAGASEPEPYGARCRRCG